MSSGGHAAAGGRNSALDGLRGCASLMVVAAHVFGVPLVAEPGTLTAYVQRLLTSLWVGVDLFFVLSGYLVGRIVLSKRGTTAFLGTFYLRRSLRILPLYAAAILVWRMLVAGVGVQDDWWTRLFGRADLLANYLTFTQNFRIGTEVGESWNVTGSWLAVTWSLCIEEHFYLVIPLLARFLGVRGVVGLASVALVCSPIARAVVASIADVPETFVYVITPFHGDGILVGLLLAAVEVTSPHQLERLRLQRWLGPLALGLGLCSAALVVRPSGLHIPRVLQAVEYTVVALFFGALTVMVSSPSSVVRH